MRLSCVGGGGVNTSLSDWSLAAVGTRSPEPWLQMTARDQMFPAHGFVFRSVGQGDVKF